jgi:hypothetical protein
LTIASRPGYFEGEASILSSACFSMHSELLLECTFYVPSAPDPHLADGGSFAPQVWERLHRELLSQFGGAIIASGLFRIMRHDPNDHRRVEFLARQFIVAVAEHRVEELRQLLAEARDWFLQRQIYLSVAGRVEFV